jgi:hypothetical protein
VEQPERSDALAGTRDVGVFASQQRQRQIAARPIQRTGRVAPGEQRLDDVEQIGMLMRDGGKPCRARRRIEIQQLVDERQAAPPAFPIVEVAWTSRADILTRARTGLWGRPP